MKKPLLLILLLGLAAAAWYGNRYGFDWNAGSSDRIRISGNIEVVDAEMSFKIGGLVTERPVEEGDPVAPGQVLAKLESADLKREVAVRQEELNTAQAVLDELLAGSRVEDIAEAEAGLQRTVARLSELEAGSRPQEIAAARAAVAQAQAEMQNAGVEYQRQKKLLADGVVPQESHDQARTRFDVARAQLAQAEEQLKLVEEGPRREEIDQARAARDEAAERFTRVRNGPRQETIDQARATRDKAKAALALARTQQDYTVLRSPMKGVVLSKNIEPGEYVAPGTPVVTVGDLDDIWLRGYIQETDLGRVKLGQKAAVFIDTYPGRIFPGKITFIASEAEFTPKNVQTRQERVKLVYRIKITLSNPRRELKPGMPADAEILLP